MVSRSQDSKLEVSSASCWVHRSSLKLKSLKALSRPWLRPKNHRGAAVAREVKQTVKVVLLLCTWRRVLGQDTASQMTLRAAACMEARCHLCVWMREEKSTSDKSDNVNADALSLIRCAVFLLWALTHSLPGYKSRCVSLHWGSVQTDSFLLVCASYRLSLLRWSLWQLRCFYKVRLELVSEIILELKML